ncbi:hypothetical protein OUZ56_016294 [Daphnia magna]|uniref:Uncharacterized protein n=1 Tax=Daphnia magna TaxID=35525 RepID=A0ABR0AQN5_9CRUS|nr:hypothetical protein OUZ56_016294 [Daphnia magna]
MHQPRMESITGEKGPGMEDDQYKNLVFTFWKIVLDHCLFSESWIISRDEPWIICMSWLHQTLLNSAGLMLAPPTGCDNTDQQMKTIDISSTVDVSSTIELN